MKFLKKIVSNNILVTAFLTSIIYISYLFFCKLLPFGDNIINFADVGHQYVPFLKYYQDIFHGTNSFPFTFSNGMGHGTFGMLCYYLLSPFNLLVLLFRPEHIPYVFSGLITIILMELLYINNRIKILKKSMLL